jgi:diguanylate cyclase (GGDEF)-like protein
VSFRNRLGLFFVLIVIVPMVAVAVLLFSLLADSEQSVGDANIGARQELAENFFLEQRRTARRPLQLVANDEAFGAALLAGDTGRAQRRAEELLTTREAERIVLVRDGVAVVKAGDKTAIAPELLPLTSDKGDLGMLGLSTIDARRYAQEVRRLTGLHIVVRNGNRLLASTLSSARDAALPIKGEIDLGDTAYRVRALTAPADFPGQKITVHTLGVPLVNADDVRAGRIFIGSILFGFLLLALACAVLVSRSLQQQLQGFLDAARRLAGGDFSAKVTTVGRDEFAGLGDEFNKMSGELERRLIELREERERVKNSMRRLGEALESKLDKDALLKIVVQTAVEGMAADGGRAYVVGPDRVSLEERASAGNLNGLHAAVAAVEAEVMRSGSPREASSGETSVMAHPLRPTTGTGAVRGVVSVGRTGSAFNSNDRELFRYLAGQASHSLENVDSYETVTREALTDALTGLPNLRAFHDALATETVRAKRLGGTQLGLAVIDLDDFKTINDSYGHPQGDAVLVEVARALQESSRGIDLPARQHGEEFALILPGADLDGAFNLAERVRMRIEALHIPRLDGRGTLRVTASCGVAAVPQTPPDTDALVAAADQALYEAKRSGKNKTMRAR